MPFIHNRSNSTSPLCAHCLASCYKTGWIADSPIRNAYDPIRTPGSETRIKLLDYNMELFHMLPGNPNPNFHADAQKSYSTMNPKRHTGCRTHPHNTIHMARLGLEIQP